MSRTVSGLAREGGLLQQTKFGDKSQPSSRVRPSNEVLRMKREQGWRKYCAERPPFPSPKMGKKKRWMKVKDLGQYRRRTNMYSKLLWTLGLSVTVTRRVLKFHRCQSLTHDRTHNYRNTRGGFFLLRQTRRLARIPNLVGCDNATAALVQSITLAALSKPTLTTAVAV